MRRYAIEKLNLIERHFKRDAHFRIEFRGIPLRIVRDRRVEFPAPPQCSEDEVRGQPGITAVEVRRLRRQRLGRPRTALHCEQRTKCGLSGSSNFQISNLRWRSKWLSQTRPVSRAAAGF